MANQDMKTVISNRLRAAREQAGLSQGQVAVLMNKQRPTISEIEAGRRNVTAEELAHLADIYGVSVNWLLNKADAQDNPSIHLAARELAKLKKEDLDKVLNLLSTLRDVNGES
ncbi:helix-turn-helix domain-containing protein [Pseudodesulfovibrio methanolicus]|uniref:Helix-turn-helix transcriptional regulator n=1 Tax=Pseudodesulfovibrio methanolicus TaxID=3126690 RepID=A0ABZ2IWG8_9BACT